ncbi:MAG TPA: putative Fe-S cluster assembly protein SufT [Acidimicrobiaceae bacterium]|nr:putative Fe-S cluster assembly protein SufT [Acidimicrobiaceae bacterium]
MTQTWNPTILQRDCDALTVPHGERVALTAGGEVEITQRLGSSVTVRTQMGTLLRIDGADADALGLDPGPETAVHVTRQTGAFDFADVMAALRGVYDPEIPINIVDLGLVYRCDEVALDDGRRRIEIDMTMTAPGCGMGDVIARDAESAVQRVAGVDEVDVTIVWDPPWNRARISEAARLELGLF